MKTSQKGIELIKKFEGCRLTSYLCPAKVLTIGYGHTGTDVKPNMTITQLQATTLLISDLEKFENGVKSLVKVKLNQYQFDSLVSFAFNCGLGNLKSSTLLKKLNSSDYIGASNEFEKWIKANGKILSGLQKRRKAEKELFLTPTVVNENKLPYNVETLSNLNIRKNPKLDSEINKTVKKGTILTVWAEETNNLKWGKNSDGYFCLDYCKKV